jgi:hypothetical protein
MAMKRGSEEAVFLRMALLESLAASPAFTKKEKKKIEKCLIAQTMPEKVISLLERVLAETSGEEFYRELEFALVENAGEGRYAKNRELLEADLQNAAINYRVYRAKDEIQVSCGYPDLRDHAMRLDDAARNTVGRQA